MTPEVALRRAVGIGAFLVLLAMIVILGSIRPGGWRSGFEPQAAMFGYTLLELQAFASELGPRGREIYRTTLVYLDTVFITMFAVWAAIHIRQFSGAWLRIMTLILLIYVATDFAENVLILVRIDREMFASGANIGPPNWLPSLLTPVKLVALAVVVLTIVVRRVSR